MLRLWLGTPYCKRNAEITADMPFLGISARRVLAELLTTGYCALDANGGVRTFFGLGAGRRRKTKPALLRNCRKAERRLPRS